MSKQRAVVDPTGIRNTKFSPISAEAFKVAAMQAGVSPLAKSYAAAKAVLCSGERVIEASASAGIRRAATYEAIARIRNEIGRLGLCPCCGASLPRNI